MQIFGTFEDLKLKFGRNGSEYKQKAAVKVVLEISDTTAYRRIQDSCSTMFGKQPKSLRPVGLVL